MNIDPNSTKISNLIGVRTDLDVTNVSMNAANEAKPILEGGLKVSVAERNVLDELQNVGNNEELSHSDEIGELVKAAFKFEPPAMPDFV